MKKKISFSYVEQSAQHLFGWMNYFGIAVKYNDAVEMDHWLRRRIRKCYMKQWNSLPAGRQG